LIGVCTITAALRYLVERRSLSQIPRLLRSVQGEEFGSTGKHSSVFDMASLKISPKCLFVAGIACGVFAKKTRTQAFTKKNSVSLAQACW
jgi:hypothetical protein